MKPELQEHRRHNEKHFDREAIRCRAEELLANAEFPDDLELFQYLFRPFKLTDDLSVGNDDIASLRPSKRRKVRCGKKHFEALDVDFQVVTDEEELL